MLRRIDLKADTDRFDDGRACRWGELRESATMFAGHRDAPESIGEAGSVGVIGNIRNYPLRRGLNSPSLAATVITADRNTQIIAQGEAAVYCFRVLAGCVRTVKLLHDGRRQVGEFLLPQGGFGWEAAERHEFGAEAVTLVTLHRFRLSAIEERANCDPGFAKWIRQHAAAQIRALQAQLIVLGRKTASERLATFLLIVSDQMLAAENTLMALPMNRADIADYLGLTIETVCRALGDFRRDGIITVSRTRIWIVDRPALALAAGERAPPFGVPAIDRARTISSSAFLASAQPLRSSARALI